MSVDAGEMLVTGTVLGPRRLHFKDPPGRPVPAAQLQPGGTGTVGDDSLTPMCLPGGREGTPGAGDADTAAVLPTPAPGHTQHRGNSRVGGALSSRQPAPRGPGAWVSPTGGAPTTSPHLGSHQPVTPHQFHFPKSPAQLRS